MGGCVWMCMFMRMCMSVFPCKCYVFLLCYSLASKALLHINTNTVLLFPPLPFTWLFSSCSLTLYSLTMTRLVYIPEEVFSWILAPVKLLHTLYARNVLGKDDFTYTCQSFWYLLASGLIMCVTTNLMFVPDLLIWKIAYLPKSFCVSHRSVRDRTCSAAYGSLFPHWGLKSDASLRLHLTTLNKSLYLSQIHFLSF